MEKIIAVVVMIAIVIGLIATAVLPMVNQMNEQGGAASSQLDMIGSTITDSDRRMGSTVVSEIQSFSSRFALSTDRLTSITINNSGRATNATANTAAQVSNAINAVDKNAMYVRTDTYYNSGALSTVTYTLQINN